MATAQEIIKKAASFIGVTEDPRGSNNVPFVIDYFGYLPPTAATSAPWCVIFVWDVFRMCGASRILYNGNKVGSCTVLWRWAQAEGRCVNDPKPGDLVLLDWNSDQTADHIGIIESVSGDKLTTIEGNCDDAVKRTTRNKAQAIAYIRPAYDNEPAQVICNAQNCPLLKYCQKIINKEES